MAEARSTSIRRARHRARPGSAPRALTRAEVERLRDGLREATLGTTAIVEEWRELGWFVAALQESVIVFASALRDVLAQQLDDDEPADGSENARP